MQTEQGEQPGTSQGIYYGWWMVLIAFLAQGLTTGGLTYSYSVIAVNMNLEFNVSRFELMLPMTAMTLAGAVVSPLLGPKVDRFPLRWFLLAGALCYSLGLLLVSLASSMTMVTVVYAVLMAPVQMLLGALTCSVLLSRWFVHRLALAMGVAAMGTSVGGFVLPPLIEWLSSGYGWRDALQWFAAGVLLIMGPLSLMVLDRPEHRGLHADGGSEAPDQSSMPTPAAFDTARAIFASRQYWLLGVTLGILFGAYSAIMSNLLSLLEDYDINYQDGAILISVISAMGMLGKLIFGVVADRIDLRAGLATAVVLVMTGSVVYMTGTTYLHFLLGSLALGLAAGGMLPVWGAMIARLFGAGNYGRVMGLMGPVIVVFNFTAVPMTGFLYDMTGSYVMPLGIFVVLMGLSLLWIPAIKPSPKVMEAAPA